MSGKWQVASGEQTFPSAQHEFGALKQRIVWDFRMNACCFSSYDL